MAHRQARFDTDRLGGIVVLTTSTLNRIMVVELALAATIPGFLVTIHQLSNWRARASATAQMWEAEGRRGSSAGCLFWASEGCLPHWALR